MPLPCNRSPLTRAAAACACVSKWQGDKKNHLKPADVRTFDALSAAGSDYAAVPLPVAAFDLFLPPQGSKASKCEDIVGFRVFLGADGRTLRSDVMAEGLFGNTGNATAIESKLTAGQFAQLPQFMRLAAAAPPGSTCEFDSNDGAEERHGYPLSAPRQAQAAALQAEVLDVSGNGEILHEILILPKDRVKVDGDAGKDPVLEVYAHNRQQGVSWIYLFGDLVDITMDDLPVSEALLLYGLTIAPAALTLMMAGVLWGQKMAESNFDDTPGRGTKAWVLLSFLASVVVVFATWFGGCLPTAIAFGCLFVIQLVSEAKNRRWYVIVATAILFLGCVVCAGAIAMFLMDYELAQEHAWALKEVMEHEVSARVPISPLLSYCFQNNSPELVCDADTMLCVGRQTQLGCALARMRRLCTSCSTSR